MAKDGLIEIKGIGLSQERAQTKPTNKVETTVSEISGNTAGKFFVGVDIIEEGDIVFGLIVDGSQVEVVDNEKRANTSVRKNDGVSYAAYALDLPMRIIGKEDQQFPCDHNIVVLWATPTTLSQGWQGSFSATITLTGASPKVKYDPVKDSD